MPHFVYILKSSKDGRRYVGSTSNVKKRIEEHNSGKNISTRYRIPLILIFQKEFRDGQSDLRYEKWLKKQKGGITVRKLIEDFNAPIA
ncbi:MAG: hypothetical protein COU07_00200 [Candidatus Harrisonbacteria bacterium CG10_big_fil_rev_8_21_14_0_10_40_38]|uniref:GIY-YIG domain-containing protein n=1 Tax=Candidatus Harrisonbacteria bacterium CG10_big_fil_rev_8_21_14_0_10_40_38 TaxID=1974583 RepID=A0A2H0USB4_9BACT|nr:MAG: hypothetical protein COU07_00200 [Candidatus Harrisonbacteria bacterium CG10_big_fil_rev_8_21_14_0_10_40_38]